MLEVEPWQRHLHNCIQESLPKRYSNLGGIRCRIPERIGLFGASGASQDIQVVIALPQQPDALPKYRARSVAQ